jgi:hypothetical protein
LEATTIFEQDRLGKKLAEQEGRKWAGSREANEAIEESLGSPRQHLIDKMATGRFKSNLERDVVELMVKDLDREEADRNRHTIDFSVYARNYDSKRR